MDSSFVTCHVNDIQEQLDKRNSETLKELNRQIDQLSSLPVGGKLPAINDSLDLELPSFNNFDNKSPTRSANNTLDSYSPTKRSKLGEIQKTEYPSRNFGKKFEFDSFYEQTNQMTQDTEALFARVELSDYGSPFSSPFSKKKELPKNDKDENIDQLFIRLKTDSRHFESKNDAKQPTENSNEYKPGDYKTLLNNNSTKEKSNIKPQSTPGQNSKSVKKTDSILKDKSAYQTILEDNHKVYESGSDIFDAYRDSEIRKIPSATFSDNDPYRAMTGVPSDSNSRAVVNALRTLQERVGKLEGEREQAKEKIRDLEQELSTTRKLLFHQQAVQKSPDRSSVKNDAVTTLDATDKTLERIAQAREQVSKLQERVEKVQNLQKDSVITERPDSPTKTLNIDKLGTSLQDYKVGNVNLQRTAEDENQKSMISNEFESFSIRKHNDAKESEDLNKLSRETPSPFSAIGTTPDLKIGDRVPFNSAERKTTSTLLQEQIENERRQRKELPTEKLQKSVISEQLAERIIGKSKLKKAGNKTPSWEANIKPKTKHNPISHIRKKAPFEIPGVEAKDDGREMPFIVGSNTGKSFSVTANLQKVFSLLKNHNPELCAACSKIKGNSKCIKHQDPEKPNNSNIKKEDPEQKSSESDKLRGILGILEEDFKNLKKKYHSLVAEYEYMAESTEKQVGNEVEASKSLKSIGDKLRLVIQSMETKGDQIAILREIVTSSLVHEQSHSKPKKIKPKRYQTDTITSKSRSRENLKRNRTLSGGLQQIDFLSKNISNAIDNRGGSPSRAATLNLLKSTLKVQKALTE